MAEDFGSIFITREVADLVTIRVRAAGSHDESEITLPFNVWARIALLEPLAVGMAGDWLPGG